MYCPDSNLLSGDIWIQMISSVKKPLIIIGDLKTIHKSWRSSSNNLKGKIFKRNLTTLNLSFKIMPVPPEFQGQEETNQ